ncbi:MAG: hypothetical protein KatS3mg032_0749 [Cyclobacteriaceae bacterium]|nr:MAG: hypothetical protein KatS3mg032_0749 [Cyclobacteriaceae bacterium]
MREAMGYVFDNVIFHYNPSTDNHQADPYLFKKGLQKLTDFIGGNPHALYYFQVALAYLYQNPGYLHRNLISVHSIPFTAQEIKPVLTEVFRHFWPEGNIAGFRLEHLMPIEIVDMPESEWDVRIAPADPSEEGLFN